MAATGFVVAKLRGLTGSGSLVITSKGGAASAMLMRGVVSAGGQAARLTLRNRNRQALWLGGIGRD